ncbi:MAG: flagellin [Defluviitaleaceae bacterium]|nr:flagellin [Defluviitaleaceae bacterium]MCL2836887.1 flagellin [Defluviitaleaceae bacterium]
MKINDNIAALNAYTNLLRTGRNMDKSVARLSSGYKINSVADDAAGMAISRKLKNQINGMSMAARNALDGVSLVGTAEGALNEVHNMLNRIRELAIQAANDTNMPEDREKMQLEIDNLLREINDIAYKTEFNTIKILGGEAEALPDTYSDCDAGFRGLRIQIGVNKGMTMTINIPDIRQIINDVFNDPAAGYNTGFTLPPGAPFPLNDFEAVNVLDQRQANLTIGFTDDVISQISKVRAQLGAYENRLRYTENSLNATREHTEAALSRVKDTDMALEMTYNVQYSIITQAGIAILGQANQRPQQILQLLQ